LAWLSQRASSTRTKARSPSRTTAMVVASSSSSRLRARLSNEGAGDWGIGLHRVACGRWPCRPRPRHHCGRPRCIGLGEPGCHVCRRRCQRCRSDASPARRSGRREPSGGDGRPWRRFLRRAQLRHDNDLGTASLLLAMHESGFMGRFVLASSMVVYGEGRYECFEHGWVRPTRAILTTWRRTASKHAVRNAARRSTRDR